MGRRGGPLGRASGASAARALAKGILIVASGWEAAARALSALRGAAAVPAEGHPRASPRRLPPAPSRHRPRGRTPQLRRPSRVTPAATPPLQTSRIRRVAVNFFGVEDLLVTMARHSVQPHHALLIATQNARSASSSCGRDRFRFSASTCCLKATFSRTRWDRDRKTSRCARSTIVRSMRNSLAMAA